MSGVADRYFLLGLTSPLICNHIADGFLLSLWIVTFVRYRLYIKLIAVETFSVHDNWQSILYLFPTLHKRYFFLTIFTQSVYRELCTNTYVYVFAIMYTAIFVWLNFILTDEAHLPLFQDEHKILVYRFAQLRSLSGNERSRRANCVIPPAAGLTNTCSTSLNRSLHFCYIFFYFIQLRLYQFYIKIKLSFRKYTRNLVGEDAWKKM